MTRQIIRPYLTSSASFNGSNTIVTSGSNTGITGSNPWSIAAIMNVSNTNICVVELGDTSGSLTGATITIYVGTQVFCTQMIGVVTSTTNLKCNFGQWYEVVLTYAGGSAGAVSMYINGVQYTLSTATQTYNITNKPLYIGSYNNGSGRTLGNIQDVRLWNVCLSAATVSNMWFTGTIPYLGQSQLVRRYILNDGTGTTPKDSSVNNDTATSSNLTWSNNTFMKPRQLISVPRKLISVPRKLITTKRLVA